MSLFGNFFGKKSSQSVPQAEYELLLQAAMNSLVRTKHIGEAEWTTVVNVAKLLAGGMIVKSVGRALADDNYAKSLQVLQRGTTIPLAAILEMTVPSPNEQEKQRVWSLLLEFLNLKMDNGSNAYLLALAMDHSADTVARTKVSFEYALFLDHLIREMVKAGRFDHGVSDWTD